MRIIQDPKKKDWLALTKRAVHSSKQINQLVKPILKKVKKKGDVALFKLTEQLDKVVLQDLTVSDEEIKNAIALVPQDLKNAMDVAVGNITQFHSQQKEMMLPVETTKGISCWRKSVAIEKVGLYIPGGTAPLFSTVLMLAIPARLAGCKQVVLCSPPNEEGKIHPAILYAAQLTGVHTIFKLGGAQAIAAMAYGTETIPKVDKIFGPGNQFVTAAKQIVNSKGIAIDMPAGPSEVMVIADKTANPIFVAADLIAQAEHGTDSQSLLLTDNLKLAKQVQKEIEKQLITLPRKEIASKSLNNSAILVFKSMELAIEFSNIYAPEHLIISTENCDDLLEKVVNAGSVFVGHFTPESLGDYASGTNHTLPTNGFATAYSGVSLDSFVKKITFQKATAEGLAILGPSVEIMAEAEQLLGHKMAVTHRLAAIQKED
jgi:histidinol dehydrogenase